MNGLMMEQPLLVSWLLRHAERHHREQQVVSRRCEGDLHRQTFAELAARARQLAKALLALQVAPDTRVATLAWNTHRHLELYYAVSGIGAVLHTLNPRLHADALAWIAEHAQDEVLFFDLTFLPLVEALAPRLPRVRHFVLMSDRHRLPVASPLDGLLCFEDLLAAQDDRFDWPAFDERRACSLCYTSGTTGNPKGVLSSHRSTLLHTLAAALPDAFDLSATDTLLPAVPMFHVNAWGLPYIACAVGARLVLPGPQVDGASLHALIEGEQVTVGAAVPTVWQGLLTHLDQTEARLSALRRVIVGGAACPPAMLQTFQQRHHVQVVHAWGMTELSPLGTVNAPKPGGPEGEARTAQQLKQGRAVFGVDLRVVDGNGRELPWDGKTPGELQVRGPWVVERYFQAGDAPAHAGGWFSTGDVAHIDAQGFVQITDRAKDVIKSGGEWIGSIELENLAASHPEVAMAACIAARHPKWDERPLLVAVRKPGSTLSRDTLLAHIAAKVAKWWVPDDVVFVDALPLGATGKVLKNQLRERYADWLVASHPETPEVPATPSLP